MEAALCRGCTFIHSASNMSWSRMTVVRRCRCADQTKRRHRAGRQFQHLLQRFRPRKGEARRAKGLFQPRQVGPLVGQHDDQPEATLAVLDEQVLAVQAWDFVVPMAALLHGEEGRVSHGAVLDAQLVQQGEEFVRGRGHGYGTALWLVGAGVMQVVRRRK